MSDSDLARRRRLELAKERDLQRKRQDKGRDVQQIVHTVLGEVHVSPLVASEWKGFQVQVAPRIEESDGLVAAYISEARANKILECCETKLATDKVGIFELEQYGFVGAFRYQDVSLTCFLTLAKDLRDRVTIHPRAVEGAIVVDYYAQNWSQVEIDFSIVTQGQELTTRLTDCFNR